MNASALDDDGLPSDETAIVQDALRSQRLNVDRVSAVDHGEPR
jgi:hypothetical protein